MENTSGRGHKQKNKPGIGGIWKTIFCVKIKKVPKTNYGKNILLLNTTSADIYSVETMTIINNIASRMAVTQAAMERRMLGITLRERKRKEWIRKKTGITDITQTVTKQKLSWTGHVMRADTADG